MMRIQHFKIFALLLVLIISSLNAYAQTNSE